MKLLAYIRVILFALTMIFYIGLILFISLFVGDKQKASLHFRRPVIILFFKILGVKIRTTGNVPKNTVLFVGNHVSYLDPFVIVYHTLAHPVAKIEISKWPLVGKTVAMSGVIFVKRRSAKSLRETRGAIAKALLEDKAVLVYPEGTTSDGSSTLPFRAGVFDIAHQECVPVIPVTVCYKNPQAPFIKKDRFLPHFISMFSSWSNEVDIHFGKPVQAENGQALAKAARHDIDLQLRVFQGNR